MATAPYQLAADVFMCLSGNRFVFLDLRRNQYLCLNRRNTKIAARVIASVKEQDASTLRQDTVIETDETRRVVQALADRGLLAQGDKKGNECTLVCVKTHGNVLFSPDSSQDLAVRASHWVAFFQASLQASAKLRWYSMQRTVRSIANRKQRRVKSQPADRDTLPQLVAIFQRLRPFYVREYLCLYDSLALVEFLAHYQYFPQWVFGVRVEPFNAHCWVQQSNYVLNDAVENVRAYTPIMIV